MLHTNAATTALQLTPCTHTLANTAVNRLINDQPAERLVCGFEQQLHAPYPARVHAGYVMLYQEAHTVLSCWFAGKPKRCTTATFTCGKQTAEDWLCLHTAAQAQGGLRAGPHPLVQAPAAERTEQRWRLPQSFAVASTQLHFGRTDSKCTAAAACAATV